MKWSFEFFSLLPNRSHSHHPPHTVSVCSTRSCAQGAQRHLTSAVVMELCGSTILHTCRHFMDKVSNPLLITLILGTWCSEALEMSVGKIPFVEAVNGSTVLLPCTYSSCIGIKNLYFNWQFNDNGTMLKVCEAVIPSETVEPHVSIYRERVDFVGTSKTNNISILLWNVTFDDEGQYTCFGRNPKEKGKNHSAVFTLIVVDELKVVDNTLTIIIASAVGGAIGLFMAFMLLKNFTLYVISKIEEKNKECLVSSSGIDNTENALSGSKVDSKATPKKA